MAIKHELVNHPLYSRWLNMRTRCNNPNFHSYKHYGGRGISICKEWDDFVKFYTWALNNGFDKKLTIDRIDNDGNYEPSNCRWTTRKVQANNKNQRKPGPMKVFCIDNNLLHFQDSICKHLRNGKSEEWIINKYKYASDEALITIKNKYKL